MRLWSITLAAALVAGVWVSGRASGQSPSVNPKLSLEARNLTCREAVEALTKAANVPVELRGVPADPDAPLLPENERIRQRRTFQWAGVTLSQALRDLCEAYGLAVHRNPDSYWLWPSPAPRPPAVPKAHHLVERKGVRLYPRDLAIFSHRNINLDAGGAILQNSHLAIDFKAMWPEGEGAAIAGFGNVVARDDLGNVLTWRRPDGPVGGFNTAQMLPDEWQGTITFDAPHPRARKLVWLEGDLLVYNPYRIVSVEVPLSGETRTGRLKGEEFEAEVIRVESPSAEEERFRQGPIVHSRLTLNEEFNQRIHFLDGRPAFAPDLIGVSGRVYAPIEGSSGGRLGDGVMIQTVRSRYAPITEPVVKAVYRLRERGEPASLFPFRLTDIPLPPENILAPQPKGPAQANAVPAPGPKVRADGPPRSQAGRGLIFRVEVASKPTRGSVSAGLALVEGGARGPVRWREIEVGPDGLARLPDLKPGTYRLFRVFRPAEAISLESGGRWEGGEIQVVLAAGKETAAPPLRWVVGSAGSRPSTPSRANRGPR